MTDSEGCFFRGLTIAAALTLAVIMVVALAVTDALTAVILLLSFGG